MREIKFRVWHKATELMDEVITIDLYDEGIGVLCANPITQGEDIQRFDFDEIELMQSTGLKDKNGFEIYENDLLKCTSKIYTNFGSTETGEYDETIKQVIWKDDGWGTRVISSNLTGKGAEKSGLVTTAKYAEVIGSIYQNNDLLEEEE